MHGDVGIEGFFADQSKLYLPVESGLREAGIRPNAKGQFKGRDIKRIAGAITSGYRTTGGARFAGVFEIKPGEPDPARLGVGIHSRPMRGLAMQARERVAQKVRTGKMAKPTTDLTGILDRAN